MNKYVISILIIFSSTINAKTYSFAGERFCPYTCSNPKAPGAMVEITKSVMNEMGHKISFEVLPFARLLNLVATGQLDGAISTPKVPPTMPFHFSNPLLSIEICMYALKSSSFKFTGMSSLKKVRIGTVTGYAYSQLSKEFGDYLKRPEGIKLNTPLSGDTPNIRLFKMLQKDRIDALPIDVNVANYLIKVGAIENNVESRGCFKKKVPLYTAFSPKIENGEDLAESFPKAFDKLRKNGTLAQILSKYGIKR